MPRLLDNMLDSLLNRMSAGRIARAQYSHECRLGFHPTILPPPNINQHRQRSLTLTDDSGALAQTPSPLLQLLPFEIRQEIWKLVLGGYTVHLQLARRLFGAMTHPTSSSLCYAYGEKCDRITSGVPSCRPLPLLLSCKQIYGEAIDYLYRHTELVTRERHVVQYLPMLILSQRLHAIQTFRFFWRHPGGPALPPDLVPAGSKLDLVGYKHSVWKETWSSLASMHGLKELRIKFFVDGDDWETMEMEKAIALLAPVMQLEGLEVFEWVLPFRCLGPVEPWDALPCKIRRVADMAALLPENEHPGA